MTIESLYQWAKENDALDLDIEVLDDTGCYTEYIDPEIYIHGWIGDNEEFHGYKTIQL